MYDAADIMHQWQRGNDDGSGFSVGEETDTPTEAAEREGWEILAEIGQTGTGNGPCVLAYAGAQDRNIAICDSNGPWGVFVDIGYDGR